MFSRLPPPPAAALHVLKCDLLRQVMDSVRFNRFCVGHLTAAICLMAAGAVPIARSQEVAGDEVVNLSPFEVNAADDVGYRSTNSTSGTSLNTRIKDLPMAVEVINRDFLDDTGAIDFREAVQYSAGVVLEEYTEDPGTGFDGNNGAGVNERGSAEVSPSSRGGLGQRFSNSINIRGFNVPFQNRDGFRYGGQIASYGVVLGGLVDTVNVNRLEVVRGPNSLLYGIGVLSGIVNMIPKRPLPEAAGSASLSVGDYDYRRATFDWTAPLKKDLWGGNLSYRIGAALTHSGHWTDFRESDSQYYVGQLQFESEKWNVFFETQYAKQKETGIGDQFVYDNLPASIDQDFRNEYYEQFNWLKDFVGLPQTTRITGPDTYAKQDEVNVLLNVDFTPIENLTISAGTFLTDLDREEFDVNISTLNNEERSLDFKGVLYQRLLAAERAAAKDPADWTPNEAEQAAQAPFLRNWFDTYAFIKDSPLKETQPPNDTRQLTDYRFVRYWWRNTPMNSSTEQYRLRAAYSFESKDFVKDAEAKHNFLVGFSSIKDEADFTAAGTGINENIGRNYALKGEFATDDPLLERHVFDPEPIRYNGEALAIPGYQMRHADVWYKSLYALYQGRVLNDNLGVILGWRWDEYHSRDRLYNRFNNFESIGDEYPYGPDYDGYLATSPPANVWWNNPNSETFGFVPPLEGQSEYSPGPDPEDAQTATFALNYRISPALTIYGLSSEGLTPNIGLKDGNNDPIASEESTSRELGLKFDLFEGKLSGTVSVYRIRRENAVWYVNSAVAPATWYGATNPPTGYFPGESSHFRPDQIEDGTYVVNYGVNNRYFQEDGVDLGAISKIIYDDEGNPIKRVKEFPEGLYGLYNQAYFFEYAKLDEPVLDKNGVPNGKTWRWYAEKAFEERFRLLHPFPQAAGPDDFDAFWYRRLQGSGIGLNPSSTVGANVTFTDEATGLDFQLVYQPTRSWQLVLTYAHTEREPISPFKMVEAVNQVTGFQYGTEYDTWVRTFGRAAFGLEEHDDDGDGVVDRVTKIGENEVLELGDVTTSDMVGGLEGISLYTGPEDTFSVFQKYSFLEGTLKGLEATLGVSYIGPAQTSIPIGGVDLAENRFGTPPTPERWIINPGIAYKWKWGDQFYDARLVINNLLDDQKGQNLVDYLDDDGSTITRRSVQYYAPRSFRFTLGVRF